MTDENQDNDNNTNRFPIKVACILMIIGLFYLFFVLYDMERGYISGFTASVESIPCYDILPSDTKYETTYLPDDYVECIHAKIEGIDKFHVKLNDWILFINNCDWWIFGIRKSPKCVWDADDGRRYIFPGMGYDGAGVWNNGNETWK